MMSIKPQCQPYVASLTWLQRFTCNTAKLVWRLALTAHTLYTVTAAEPNLKMRLNLLLADASGASQFTLVAVKILFRLTSSSKAFHGSCRAQPQKCWSEICTTWCNKHAGSGAGGAPWRLCTFSPALSHPQKVSPWPSNSQYH